jgi:TetR/AcrR family transcriptional regulator, transcriptional repressor for nem operon
MPWPKEHKRNTRERIIEAAASAFRQRGIADVGVADIMRDAGLTHGGFYAHFASKEELLTEALRFASAQVSNLLAPEEREVQRAGERRSHSADRPEPPPQLRAALTYLSSPHAGHPEWGCPIAALGPELARGSEKQRKALAAGIRGRLKQLLELTPANTSAATRERQAAGALACMVGGVVLARGLPEAEGLEILQQCQRFLAEALATSDERA